MLEFTTNLFLWLAMIVGLALAAFIVACIGAGIVAMYRCVRSGDDA